MINPIKNREKSTRGIATAERIMRYLATITTSAGSYIWAASTARKYMPSEWGDMSAFSASVISGIAAAAIMGWITDYMFGELLQRVSYDLLASRHPNIIKWQGANYFKSLRRAETAGFCVLLVALLAFDLYTTLIIRDPVADEARQLEITDVASATASISAEQRSGTTAISDQIKSIKSDIAAEERRVIASNAALVKLAGEGNGWAQRELSKKKSSATKSMKKELEQLNSTYTRALDAGSSALSESTKLLNEQNQKRAEQNERNKAVMAGMYTAFTVIPKLLSILLRVLMVISFLAYSVNYNPDLTGDGIIDYADVEEYHTARVRERNARRASSHVNPGFPPARPT